MRSHRERRLISCDTELSTGTAPRSAISCERASPGHGEQVETVIIGGGQAGLAVGHMLESLGREHVILERGQVGNSWRSERWDSFRLVIPSGYWHMPGIGYDGDRPDGFMSKQEIITRFKRYETEAGPPVRTGTPVREVWPERAGRFVTQIDEGTIGSRNVVVATGPFQAPRVPAWSGRLDPGIAQIHSQRYRRPDQLPDGAVLVVGSAQSGVQIAEQLLDAGRRTLLCVGSRGWLPRRYLGEDITTWYLEMGLFETKIDEFPSLTAARASGFAQLAGDDGLGHDLNVHTLEQRGAVLLGPAIGGDGWRIFLGDLEANLRAADEFAAKAKMSIDQYVEKTGAEPVDDDPWPRYEAPRREPTETIDLRAEGVRSVVWAAGYRPDYGWLKAPVLDELGWPRHRRGVTDQPGLFFAGLEWLHRRKSATLMAGEEDAGHIAAAIAGESRW